MIEVRAPARGGEGEGGVDPAGLERLYAHDAGVLRANFVVSLDGAVEVDGRSGPLGDPDDLEVFATLRAVADVVMVGAGTARIEGYGPAWLAGGRRSRRAGRGQPELPPLAVVTRSARLDPGSRLFGERRDGQPEPPRPWILTCEAAPADRLAALRAVAHVVVCGERDVDLPAALAALRGAGLDRVVCEGGPSLFGDLLAGGLVGELCLTHAPVVAGPGRRRLSAGLGEEPGGLPRFRVAHVLRGDGPVLVRYVVERDGER